MTVIYKYYAQTFQSEENCDCSLEFGVTTAVGQQRWRLRNLVQKDFFKKCAVGMLGLNLRVKFKAALWKKNQPFCCNSAQHKQKLTWPPQRSLSSSLIIATVCPRTSVSHTCARLHTSDRNQEERADAVAPILAPLQWQSGRVRVDLELLPLTYKRPNDLSGPSPVFMSFYQPRRTSWTLRSAAPLTFLYTVIIITGGLKM